MSSFLITSRTLYALILTDMYLNTELAFHSTKNARISLLIGHFVVMLLILFTIFLLMWNTFLFLYGLLGSLFQELKEFVILFPIYLISSISFNIWKELSDVPLNSFYNFTFILHSILSILFYASALNASLKLGNPKMYNEDLYFQDEK
mmetsp:Transcript_51663/g.63235  ORF Transcript_51663/g.63235 Transcript_51663/m.63235 type:complete len:148 (+) Transcript_51663:25-468(+)